MIFSLPSSQHTVGTESSPFSPETSDLEMSAPSYPEETL